MSSFLRETKEARKKKATLKKKKICLHRRGANGASRRSRSSAAGLAHDACIISSVLKMRPSASFVNLRIRDTKRSSYDEDDEAEAESDLDDFIVHSSEEERQADAARQQRRSEKLQRKQKQKKSKRDAEPAAEVKARKDGFVPALKKSKPSRGIVVDSDEESDGDAKEGQTATKGDDAREEEDDDGEDSEEDSDESDEEEEDENLLYLKVPIQLDDHQHHAVVSRVCEVIAVS